MKTQEGAIHLGAIPEPGSAGLLAMAALAYGAAGIRRRRKTVEKVDSD